MHISFLSALVATGHLVAAAALPKSSAPPALPLSAFNTTQFHGLSLAELNAGVKNLPEPAAPEQRIQLAITATCSNPSVRREWHNLSDSAKQAFVDGIKCLLNKPAQNGGGAQNRYEDLVRLHQSVTPNVHTGIVEGQTNHKFLIWHRYFLWVFDDILRTECGYTGEGIPWFDERNYAGRFGASSVFSSQWFGSIFPGDANSNCVVDGQFANLALNIGPGSGNTRHCLSRRGDGSKTANTNSDYVNACNGRSPYSNMALCAEQGAHAWGHNGIGGSMQDPFASVGDPVFMLHHAFIDRNFRVWQNADYPNRVNTIDGTNTGSTLTLDTRLFSNGLRPDVALRGFMDTLSGTVVSGVNTPLCYKYDY